MKILKLLFGVPLLIVSGCDMKSNVRDYEFVFVDASTGESLTGVAVEWHRVSYPSIGEIEVEKVDLGESIITDRFFVRNAEENDSFVFSRDGFWNSTALVRSDFSVALTYPNRMEAGEVFLPSRIEPYSREVVVPMVKEGHEAPLPEEGLRRVD